MKGLRSKSAEMVAIGAFVVRSTAVTVRRPKRRRVPTPRSSTNPRDPSDSPLSPALPGVAGSPLRALGTIDTRVSGTPFTPGTV